MNTTPEQLRLAADIKENGWEWEWLFDRGKLEWRDPILPANVALYVAQGTKIRRKVKPLDFAPIPDGAERHNPTGLTPEQVGEAYRLLVVGEPVPKGYQWHSTCACEWQEALLTGTIGKPVGTEVQTGTTLRTPLSTPYPDGSRVVDGKLVKPWKPRFKVGDRVKKFDVTGEVIEVTEGHGGGPYRVKWNNGANLREWEISLEPAPEPAKVPLGPDDVPVGSLFCHPNQPDIFYTPLQISGGGIVTYNGHDHSYDIAGYPKDGGGKAGVWHRSWETLQKEGWQIHRPGNIDANGKPVFEPCWKLP